ncbi:MAG: hypothetical protein ACREIJ_13140, partial [Nitrospiraceae bacterium]
KSEQAWISVNMMKRPIRKAAVTEKKEGVVIDQERDCNRQRQGLLSVIGLTIAAMMLGGCGLHRVTRSGPG